MSLTPFRSDSWCLVISNVAMFCTVYVKEMWYPLTTEDWCRDGILNLSYWLHFCETCAVIVYYMRRLVDYRLDICTTLAQWQNAGLVISRSRGRSRQKQRENLLLYSKLSVRTLFFRIHSTLALL